MKYINDHLATYSGEDFELVDWDDLQKKYAKDLKEAELADDSRMKSRYETDNTAERVASLREMIAQELESEYAAEDMEVPSVSSFDLYQTVKACADKNKRDAGLRALTVHAEQIWKADREASLDCGTVEGLKKHYKKHYPKSAAVSAIESAENNGYIMFNRGKLMGIAASVNSQEDFDYACRVNGLASNTPRNIKARQFLLAMVNKKAQMKGWDPEKYKEWEDDEEDEEEVKEYFTKDKAAQMAGWDTEQYEDFSSDQYNRQGIMDDDLKNAVADADVELVQHLLEQGANPSADGAEAFRAAMNLGYHEIMDLFEQYGFSKEDYEEVYGNSTQDKAKELGIPMYNEDELVQASSEEDEEEYEDSEDME